MQCGSVQLVQDVFDKYTDENGVTSEIKRFTWRKGNASVQVITYGGTITSIKLPDKHGNIEDIVCGFDDMKGYLNPQNPYFGATVGRVANRIAKGVMRVEGVEYKLPVNNGPNHLHGGIKGFDKVVWDSYVKGSKVVLGYHSEDGEEGYPGTVLMNITFELTRNNELIIDYKATATKPTPVNLSNHSYFNLAGHSKNAEEAYKHVICINADKYTEIDNNSMIPTGNLPSVHGTVFDLRVPKVLGDVINKIPDSPGYDHNFCITKGSNQETAFVASVTHPQSGRVMEVYTTQPGVQFYTGNFLPENESLKTKNGTCIQKHGAFCFETQNYPDAVNQETFPSSILYPGDQYHHQTVYKFFVQKICST